MCLICSAIYNNAMAEQQWIQQLFQKVDRKRRAPSQLAGRREQSRQAYLPKDLLDMRLDPEMPEGSRAPENYLEVMVEWEGYQPCQATWQPYTDYLHNPDLRDAAKR